MKQHNRRTGAEQAGRVRMFIKADLGWLDGYPTEPAQAGRLPWRTTPGAPSGPEETLHLSGATLHRATRTWSKASRKYRRALAIVVHDAPQWTARVDALLNLLKAPIHTGAALPDPLTPAHWPATTLALAARIQRRWPTLRPTVVALTWSAFIEPARLVRRLEALESIGDDLAAAWPTFQAPRTLAVRLTWLATQHGPQHVRPVLRMTHLLHHRPTPSVELSQRARSLETKLRRLIKGRDTKPIEPVHLLKPTCLIHWAHALIRRPRSQQAAALSAFAAAMPPGFPDPWASRWQRLEGLERHYAGLVCGAEYSPQVRSAAMAAAERAKALIEHAPAPFSLRRYLEAVDFASRSAITWHGATVQAIDALSAHPEPTLGLSLLGHWSIDDGAPHARVRAWLEAIARWIPTQPSEPHPSWPWADVSGERTYRNGLDDVVLNEHPQLDPDLICQGLTALREALEHPTEDDAEVLVALLRVGASPREAAQRIHQLRPVQSALSWDAAEVIADLHQLAGPDGPLVALVKVVGGVPRDRADLQTLAQRIPRPALLHLATTGHFNALSVLATTTRVLGAKHAAVPPWPSSTSTPDHHHQPALRAGLTALAAWHPSPQKAAQRILANDLPDPAALLREISALEARATAQPALLKRRDQLLDRLNNPRPISPARLAHLNDKLFNAACVGGLATWTAALEAPFSAALTEDVGTVTPWMHRPRFRRVLPELLNLERPFRLLALELLRRRAGPPPWDHRDAPANQAFMARMAARGLDLEPWLSHTAGGSALQIERDPLELLHMGGHFQTCLSPGAYNFFSVVANIVDANKQVLYARDPDGRVVGRRLMALSRSGGLLLFQAYQHPAAGDFAQRSLAFAEALATRMGTLLVASGRVEPLLAPDWYDDGARSPAGVPPAFEDGSALRARLPEMALSDLRPALEAALRPLPLNPLTLGGFLSCPEVRARPALAEPLLPLLLELPGEGHAWIAAVEVLAESHPDAARALLKRHARRGLRGGHDGYLNPAITEPLVQLAPTWLLRLIGRREGRRMPGDAFNRDYWRGRAFEALGRSSLATEAYARSAHGHERCRCPLHEDARRRLAIG
jgi:hypothetical protein